MSYALELIATNQIVIFRIPCFVSIVVSTQVTTIEYHRERYCDEKSAWNSVKRMSCDEMYTYEMPRIARAELAHKRTRQYTTVDRETNQWRSNAVD